MCVISLLRGLSLNGRLGDAGSSASCTDLNKFAVWTLSGVVDVLEHFLPAARWVVPEPRLPISTSGIVPFLDCEVLGTLWIGPLCAGCSAGSGRAIYRVPTSLQIGALLCLMTGFMTLEVFFFSLGLPGRCQWRVWREN